MYQDDLNPECSIAILVGNINYTYNQIHSQPSCMEMARN